MRRDPRRLLDGAAHTLLDDDVDPGLAARVGDDLRVARDVPPAFDVDAGARRFAATIGIGGAAVDLPGGDLPALDPGALGSAAAPTGAAGSAGSAALGSGSLGSGAVGSGAVGSGAVGSGALASFGSGALAVKLTVASVLVVGGVSTTVLVASGPAPAVDRAVVMTPHVTTSRPSASAPSPLAAPTAPPDDVTAPPDDVTTRPDGESAPPGDDARPDESAATSDGSAAKSDAPAAGVGASAARAVPPPAPPGASSTSVRPEMEHLAGVRQATDAAAMLARAEEGHARFPRGVFWQEREALAIAALARLGRGAEARARAQAFASDHPESPYAREMRRLAGEASTSDESGADPVP